MADEQRDLVHTVDHFWDVPRTGVADYRGEPHFYESAFDESADDYSDVYALTPIDADTLAMALEAFGIWQRWRTAFDTGLVGDDSHPALPNDRPRYDELQTSLRTRLKTDFSHAVRATASFLARDEASTATGSLRPLSVVWTPQ